MAESTRAGSLTGTQLKVQNISALIPSMVPARLKRSSPRVTGPQSRAAWCTARDQRPWSVTDRKKEGTLANNTDLQDCVKFLHWGSCLWRISHFGLFFFPSHVNEFVFCDSCDWGTWSQLGEGILSCIRIKGHTFCKANFSETESFAKYSRSSDPNSY